MLRSSRRNASAGNRARVCLSAWLLVGLAGSARAEAVTVSVQESDGTYSVSGEFVTDAPPRVAWSVLTDYDRLDAFVGGMRRSRSERDPDGRLVVRQTAAVGIFPLRKVVRVALEIAEDEGSRIVFSDVLKKDFDFYFGEWSLSSEAGGTRVSYQLQAAPKAFVPFVGRGIAGRNARTLLSQVSAEMTRRLDSSPTAGP